MRATINKGRDLADKLRKVEEIATAKWTRRISRMEAELADMASEFESQHVDIPTAHVVPFTRAWKLREPELDSRLREWVIA